MGLRFQDVQIPPGSIVTGASIMLTVDESHNTEETRFTEWMTSTIKMRKTAHAPEWLPQDSTNPDVVANRDCPLESSCMPNYE